MTVLACASLAVVGVIVALLGSPGFGWSLFSFNVLLGALHGLRYLSVSKGDEDE
jgi:hypothetical protein